MTEDQRVTAAREAVHEMLHCEYADVLRESVAFVIAELIEAEVSALVRTEHGERAPGGARRSATAIVGAGRSRAGDPQAAHWELNAAEPGAAQTCRAGAGRGRCRRPTSTVINAQGRPSRRADGAARHE